MDETSGAFRPPHMAYATFWNYITDLSSRPLPPQIDRGMLRSKSGTDQNNLTAALTTFGLIGENQRVTPKLIALAVDDEEKRKAGIATLVKEYYPDAVALSEQHGTQQQLQDLFKEKFGLDTPDTRRKAITFFLHAARAGGLPISAHFPVTRPGSGAPGSPKPRKPRANRKASGTSTGSTGAATTPNEQADTGGTSVFSTAVKIKAGTVKLTVNVNPIELRGADRTFFFDLVDKMEDYAAAHPSSPAENGAAPVSDVGGGGS